MADDVFIFLEDDLLKHHVRTTAWLPLCRKRLRIIREAGRLGETRRLRYFTFCAVGALDVLLLDVARVIRPSKNYGFDTVVFFDKNQEFVIETQKRIPGATGFPGDFINVVLAEDPDEEYVIEGGEALTPPATERDVSATRNRQLLLAQHREFIRQFPFDVINLDLEQYLFRPKEELPGQLIRALRKIFAWQIKPLTTPQVTNQRLDGFSLMFTTQIGPPNLTDEYLNMLRDRLIANLNSDDQLRPLLIERTGLDDVEALKGTQFNNFFKLGVPKILAATLMDEDWFIDSESGVIMYEFERPSKDGPYRMLHLVMDVKRKRPPKDNRAPGDDSAEAQAAYREVVRQIFSRRETVVTLESIDQVGLREDLDRIKARRKMYYPSEETPDVSS